MANLPDLRKIYDGFRREEPLLKGRITVKFAVDAVGCVIFVETVENSTGNGSFGQAVAQSVRRWAFGRTDHPGDITEVIYPFVFTSDD